MPLTDTSSFIRKADPDVHDRRVQALKDALKSGVHPSTAASYAGISSSTLSRWVEEGRSLADIKEAVDADPDDDREASPSELELIWLAREYEHARATAEVNLVKVIREAAAGEWRAAGWLLERGFKERWSKRSEVTGADGGALQVENASERRKAIEEGLAALGERIAEAEELREQEEAGKAEVVSIERMSDGDDDGEQDAAG